MNINKRIEQLEKELEILKADVKKKNNVWKPKKEENYFTIEDDGRIIERININQEKTNNRLSIGNVFKTHEAAEFAVEKMRVEQELRKYAEPFDPDKKQWEMNYDYRNETIFKIWTEILNTQGAFYFESEETLQKAIDEIGEDRIKKYIFGIEED